MTICVKISRELPYTIEQVSHKPLSWCRAVCNELAGQDKQAISPLNTPVNSQTKIKEDIRLLEATGGTIEKVK